MLDCSSYVEGCHISIGKIIAMKYHQMYTSQIVNPLLKWTIFDRNVCSTSLCSEFLGYVPQFYGNFALKLQIDFKEFNCRVALLNLANFG